jgi:hypothetical protein
VHGNTVADRLYFLFFLEMFGIKARNWGIDDSDAIGGRNTKELQAFDDGAEITSTITAKDYARQSG